MTTQTVENAIIEKTRALCQAIVEQPEMSSIRQRIDSFMSDTAARGQYETVMSKGQALQEKQSQGQQLADTEIADFEKHRDALLNNPVSRGFLDAREELHEIQHSIQKYVSKTLELGRVPTAEDMEDHACGDGGCGCHH
ncbi:MAG TPA: YlbF family regulator [Verrucomicrobiae bacterium]|nr:YlbF family regulator [Verrucomicrobiae bacterium]